jgi:hypothetical protein
VDVNGDRGTGRLSCAIPHATKIVTVNAKRKADTKGLGRVIWSFRHLALILVMVIGWIDGSTLQQSLKIIKDYCLSTYP